MLCYDYDNGRYCRDCMLLLSPGKSRADCRFSKIWAESVGVSFSRDCVSVWVCANWYVFPMMTTCIFTSVF